MSRRPPRDERGSALVEFSWLGLMLIVPLVWILLAVFDVQQGAFATTSAARAAGRAYVLSPDEATASRRAQAAAEIVMRDRAGEGAKTTVSVACVPHPRACLTPGSVVTVTVRTLVPVPFLPEILGEPGPGVKVAARHRLPVGTFVEAPDAR